MTEDPGFVGWLLVVGTVGGLAMVGHPALIRVWTMPRDQHAAMVAKHRTVWALLNAGFVLATISTAAAIILLGSQVYQGTAWAQPILVCGVAYAFGGLLWCAVLAIRTRTTPLLHDLGPKSYGDPPVRLLDAITGGLFEAFVVICSIALATLGVVLLLAGGLPAILAIATLVSGLGFIVWLLASGDVIPAVLYLPTLAIGIALLAGWT